MLIYMDYEALEMEEWNKAKSFSNLVTDFQ